MNNPERINSELYKEISKHKTDTTDAISKIYDIADTTRFQAKVATEIYEEIQYVLQQANTLDETRDVLQRTAEQSKRLAIFGLTQAKNQERISKNYAIDALNIPASIRHHVPKKENFKTTNAFSDEFMDSLYQARWEQVISKPSTNNFNNNRNRGNGNNSRGYRGNSHGYKGHRGGQNRFFEQGQVGNPNNPPTYNNQNSTNNNSSTSNNLNNNNRQ